MGWVVIDAQTRQGAVISVSKRSALNFGYSEQTMGSRPARKRSTRISDS